MQYKRIGDHVTKIFQFSYRQVSAQYRKYGQGAHFGSLNSYFIHSIVDYYKNKYKYKNGTIKMRLAANAREPVASIKLVRRLVSPFSLPKLRVRIFFNLFEEYGLDVPFFNLSLASDSSGQQTFFDLRSCRP